MLKIALYCQFDHHDARVAATESLLPEAIQYLLKIGSVRFHKFRAPGRSSCINAQLSFYLFVYLLIDNFLGLQYGISDCLGIRAAMTDDDHAIDAKQGNAAIFGIIKGLFQSAKRWLEQIGADVILQSFSDSAPQI